MIFYVVPYREVNLGTASFSCKRRFKSTAVTWDKLCQSVKLYDRLLWREIFPYQDNPQRPK